ncbi:hypothetical protein C0995_014809 [Termitomyces sp. Mi166|nr:hypothetical protein C0995_014809 [Termitomyces sp. Mi166\
MSGWFDAATVREFEAARENSRWPPFITSGPYVLPCLHTLRLEDVDMKRLYQFSFPHLRHLDITSLSDDDDDEEDLDGYATQDHFPASITHLIYVGESTSFAQIFRLFPHLWQLTVPIEWSTIPPSDYKDIKCHRNLGVVEIASWDGVFDPRPLIRDVLIAVRARKLPSLHLIKLTFPWKYREELPFEECEALGVTLEVVLRPKATFYGHANF